MLAKAGKQEGRLYAGPMVLEPWRPSQSMSVGWWAAKSWVPAGPNQALDTAQLEEALGSATIGQLTNETGLSGEDFFAPLRFGDGGGEPALPASPALSDRHGLGR